MKLEFYCLVRYIKKMNDYKNDVRREGKPHQIIIQMGWLYSLLTIVTKILNM